MYCRKTTCDGCQTDRIDGTNCDLHTVEISGGKFIVVWVSVFMFDGQVSPQYLSINSLNFADGLITASAFSGHSL